MCASAGHNLEGILAAHGSGAVGLSHERHATLLHVDVGGGTTKLGVLRDGEILSTAAIHVGGRLVAFDAESRITRIEPSALVLAESLGVSLRMGEPLSRNRPPAAGRGAGRRPGRVSLGTTSVRSGAGLPSNR